MENSDVVGTLLSGYSVGINALIDQAEKDLEAANAAIKDAEANGRTDDNAIANAASAAKALEILTKMLEGEPSDEIAEGILLYKEELDAFEKKYPDDPEVSIYKTIKARAAAKQDEAVKAQETLDAANARYEAAAAKVKDAQTKLDDLMKKISDGKFQFENAVGKAQRELAAANEQLKAAEAGRDAALEAQQEAEDAYVEAMRLVITVAAITNPENPGVTAGSTGGSNADGEDDGNDGDSDAGGITIEDEAVPLISGPVTRAQFVDYLWRHEGSPEAGAPTFSDVPADHEFARAIGWAQAAGLVVGYSDDTFRPDELVTVQVVRVILERFAGVFGGNAVDPAALTALTGENGEAVLNCDEVLAEFFGEEIISAGDGNADAA